MITDQLCLSRILYWLTFCFYLVLTATLTNRYHFSPFREEESELSCDLPKFILTTAQAEGPDCMAQTWSLFNSCVRLIFANSCYPNSNVLIFILDTWRQARCIAANVSKMSTNYYGFSLAKTDRTPLIMT